MGDYKRLHREKIYQGAIVGIYKDTMQLKDGSIQDWDFISHPGAAAVVAVDEEGRLLMVRQYRNALERETIELPAGGKNPDEDMETCAIRELEEETGYLAGHLEKLCEIYTTVALMNERIGIYLCTDLKPTQQHLDEGEFLGVERYTLEELTQWILESKIQDSKTICGILAYKTKLGL